MRIEREKMPVLTLDDPIFSIFPITTQDSHILFWEQEDNFTGLQQVRGLDGQPAAVKRKGAKSYEMTPGTYGEFVPLSETELTARRQYGSFNVPVDISDLVMSAQDQLLNRRVDRLRKMLWDLALTGTFSVFGPDGALMHTDTFATQTFTASVPWATSATATPLADLRQMKYLQRGKSVRFDKSAKLYANATTINGILANGNSTDFYGRRVTGLATANSIDDVNEILTNDNLPSLVEYDESYIDDTGAVQLFIPNSKALLVGQRPGGQKLADFAYTRNVNTPNMAPGPYMEVVESPRPPKTYEVHDGFNGGPRLYYPSAFVSINC